MMNALGDAVSTDQFVVVFICILLIAYFCYKEWPDFKKRMSKDDVKEQKSESDEKQILKRLDSIEEDVKDIKEKMNRDFKRLNDVEEETRKQQLRIEESLEERRILMQGLLGALGGLQELGANGPTKAAEKEIREYLNKQAHRSE